MVGLPDGKKIEDIYNGLDTVPACDRRTSCHDIYALCMCRAVKNKFCMQKN